MRFLGAVHKQVSVALNVKLTFRGGGGLACDVMILLNRSILVPCVCWSY